MPNVQWNDIPFRLQSSAGLLELNPIRGTVGSDPPEGGPQWILLPEGCQAGSAKRVARDNSPQKGGEIIHRKFKAGLVMQLQLIGVDIVNIEPAEMLPACGSDLVDLFDNLLLHLNKMENADGRLFWLPTGKAARMMDAARWLGSDGQAGGAFTSVVTSQDDEVFTTAQFALLCPFPYVMDAAQTTTNLGGSTPSTIDQTGNADFFPVIRVFGPTDTFTIYNHTTGFSLTYDSAFPGASTVASGHAIEFDFFRETAYFGLAAGPFTGANAKPGIDVLNSDFWSLVPGPNDIEIQGASADMLWQAAYSG